jgi:carbon-monoxide dehydrogenase medium subunit
VIPSQFDYIRARSLQDATDRLKELGEDAKILAGGHSLIPLMRLRFATPTALIDIIGLDELKLIHKLDNRLHVGALASHHDIEDSEIVMESLPLLAEMARQIGDPQIRNRGTLGGSVSHADPGSEYSTLCVMLDAEIVTTKRKLAARDFYKGVFTTTLEPDEILTEVVFPVEKGPHKYIKFCKRLFDWAIVGAAAQQTDSGWRIGLSNVDQVPIRAVSVEAALASGASLIEASSLASDGLNPSETLRATPEFKKHLARVLTRRAIENALTLET